MRIAIDALGISRPGGGRSATLNLLEPLFALDARNDYLVFVDGVEPSIQGHANVRQIVAPTSHRFAVRGWAQATWPGLFRRERVDLCHHTKNLTTYLLPCPSLVTIHDLTTLARPEAYPWVDVLYWKTVERFSVRHVDRVIAVSQRTAIDVQHYYGVPPERIVTIYEGIDEAFAPVAPERVARVRERYGLPEGYLLHVGSISPKKNLLALARAYDALLAAGDYEGGLALVGRHYRRSGDPALEAYLAARPADGRVILTGAVPQADLPALYAGADCFVFPSLHEGFGLVPLESMACGTPVVAARVGALAEMVGDAAILLDAPDADDLAAALADLLGDSARRKRLRALGLARAEGFSRVNAARKTLALYESFA